MATRVEINQGGGWKIALLAIIVALGALAYIFYGKYKDEKVRATEMAGNAVALTERVQQYKVELDKKTSLFVSQAHQLTLVIDDYKRIRSQDAALIKKLKTNIKDLRSAATVTIITRDTVPGDTVYIDRNQAIVAEYTSKWIDISCTIEKGLKEPVFAYAKRDSLKLVKEVPYKRIFWGLIRWPAEKSAIYKVVSLDPKTEVVGLEYIEIRK